MSKRHKRKFITEARCLNCQTVLTDQFCAHCGQKAGLDKDSFWHMVMHFTADYFHYDGKFLVTVKELFLRPGRATRNYINGQRKKYLNPIQMYLFVSAIFLLVSSHEYEKRVSPKHKKVDIQEINKRYKETQHFRDSVFQHEKYGNTYKPNSTPYGFIVKRKVSTLAQYDSCEASLPEDLRDGFFKRMYHRKLLQLNEETLDATTLGNEQFFRAIVHNLPKAFFLLLPLFAFVLSMLFNKFPFTDHLIFSLHYHVVAFILLSLGLFLESFFTETTSMIFMAGIILINFVYLVVAIKNAFLESWGLTLGRFVVFTLIYGLMLIGVFLGLSILSYFLI